MAKSRILVIDDEALMREYVEEALVRSGYEVTTATNGRDGLQLLREKGFDAVVTDLKMTPVDGLEVVRRI
ncbi:MAG TPA: response regulator, partial [Candidatus Hydrogenedentes bacterium]|nr:response regulator [Candidatus Hydrogenedentota bacterium]